MGHSLTYIIKNITTSKLNFKPPKTLKKSRLWVLNWVWDFESYLLMEIYIIFLLQILRFSSRFRGFELKNFLCRPFMVTANITWLVVPPKRFFISSQFINIHDAIRDDVHIHLATLIVQRPIVGTRIVGTRVKSESDQPWEKWIFLLL